jgi:hypothetical protein
MKRRKAGGGAGQLWNPQATLSGRKLKRASSKLTDYELNPQISGYRRVADELSSERGAAQTGLEQLGSRLGSNVASSYQGLAQAEAQNVARQSAIKNMLTQNSQGIANQAQQQQDTGQQGQLGGYMEGLQARGAQGGGQAQQALADMVAAQRARLATTNAAAQQTAVSQGAGATSFAANQAAANQQRGTEAQTTLQNTIGSRVGESNLRYGQDIRDTLGKLSDAQALRGSTRVKNLMDLRKSERDYILGQGAIGQRSQSAKLSAATTRRGQDMTLQGKIQSLQQQAAQNQISNAQAQQRIKIAKKNARQSGHGRH